LPALWLCSLLGHLCLWLRNADVCYTGVVARLPFWTEGREGERTSILIKKERYSYGGELRRVKKCFVCNFIFENYDQLKQSVVESEEIKNY
jgi:hypothetical protein